MYLASRNTKKEKISKQADNPLKLKSIRFLTKCQISQEIARQKQKFEYFLLSCFSCLVLFWRAWLRLLSSISGYLRHRLYDAGISSATGLRSFWEILFRGKPYYNYYRELKLCIRRWIFVNIFQDRKHSHIEIESITEGKKTSGIANLDFIHEMFFPENRKLEEVCYVPTTCFLKVD